MSVMYLCGCKFFCRQKASMHGKKENNVRVEEEGKNDEGTKTTISMEGFQRLLSFYFSSKDSGEGQDLHTIHRTITDRGARWVEVFSWEPKALICHNFLSKDECEYLINLAKPHMTRAKVADGTTGNPYESSTRTNFGKFIARGLDQKVREIEKRIANFTLIPVENGEGLQILHYEVGQKFEPHYDYLNNQFSPKNGGPRMATVVIYLSDVEEGGETVFPKAKRNISAVPGQVKLSTCDKRGLHVKPKMGDALLFFSMKPDGTLDPSSFHGSKPVIKGNKWASTKWLHVNEFKA